VTIDVPAARLVSRLVPATGGIVLGLPATGVLSLPTTGVIMLGLLATGVIVLRLLAARLTAFVTLPAARPIVIPVTATGVMTISIFATWLIVLGGPATRLVTLDRLATSYIMVGVCRVPGNTFHLRCVISRIVSRRVSATIDNGLDPIQSLPKIIFEAIKLATQRLDLALETRRGKLWVGLAVTNPGERSEPHGGREHHSRQRPEFGHAFSLPKNA
jgi:hypothetical protein